MDDCQGFVEAELLPCPFCGDRDIRTFHRGHPTAGAWVVECKSCSCELTSLASQTDAWARWNKRASDETNEWRPMETAPKGMLIEGLNADGDIDRVEYRETRQCMLSTVASGAGECGAGWVSKDAGNLPVDPPTAWRPIRALGPRIVSRTSEDDRVLGDQLEQLFEDTKEPPSEKASEGQS